MQNRARQDRGLLSRAPKAGITRFLQAAAAGAAFHIAPVKKPRAIQKEQVIVRKEASPEGVCFFTVSPAAHPARR